MYGDAQFLSLSTSVRGYPSYSMERNKSGFLIRFLAWTKLAQAKLWVSQCIFNWLTMISEEQIAIQIFIDSFRCNSMHAHFVADMLAIIVTFY